VKNLDGLSNAEILDIVAQIGEEQFYRLDRLEITKYNLLFGELRLYIDELKSRPGDRRVLLREHYAHPNLQVRLNAAIHTLVVVPEEARAQLETIRDRKRYPQAGDAASCLDSLATGFFVPE
jgi:hypothetical protein